MSKLEYTKTPYDIKREAKDLIENQTVRFIKHQEAFKFNIGDILVMQCKYGGQWVTRVSYGATGVPVKFMYVFENEIGIGYIKQLRVNGKGFTTLTTCVADINPEEVRLILDPELVDHMLLSDKGEEFDYSKMHADRMAFRKEAIEKNKKLLLDLSTPELRVKWFYSLKKGDAVWIGRDWDSIVSDPQVVSQVQDLPFASVMGHDIDSIRGTREAALIKSMGSIYRYVTVKGKNGWDRQYQIMDIPSLKVLVSKPWSLKESDSI